MKSFIIAAIATNGVIGDGPNLPWGNMSGDEAHLFKTIEDCVLLTGRKSLQSEQALRLFKDRQDQTIVLTHQEEFGAFLIAQDVTKAFELAKTLSGRALAVLGGATVYEQTLHLVEELIITEIHSIFKGDAYFPEIKAEHWHEIERKKYPADANNSYDYSLVRYLKRAF